MKKIEIIKLPNGKIRKRVITINEEPSMTDQSQAAETDVNYIMDKFMKTGQITHLTSKQAMYRDLTNIPSLGEALTTITKANEAFATLPAKLREKFGNSPELFVSYLQDPKNDKEAIELGLKEAILPDVQTQMLSELQKINKNSSNQPPKKDVPTKGD